MFVLCALGIPDEAQLNGSVDTASHSIFKGEIGDGEHRMVNGGNVWYKNHSGEDNVEPNGSTKKICQNVSFRV
jgi:hypothetical protein